ncbi:MAG: hypothetical protein M3429_11365 [Verrucomicrobiota bacterium]|nr:hypothetical protein [Verrucomicrobiota bacterium]
MIKLTWRPSIRGVSASERSTSNYDRGEKAKKTISLSATGSTRFRQSAFTHATARRARAPDRFAHLALVGPSASYINDPSANYVGGFDRPDIEGLLEMMDKNYLGWASFLAPAIMKNADRPELTAELEQGFCSTDPKIARRFTQVTFLSDHRADFARLTVPSLVMQCSEDTIAPISAGEFVAEQAFGSTFVGVGSVFTISLPAAAAPVEAVPVTR